MTKTTTDLSIDARAHLPEWHQRLNVVSGSMVLAFKQQEIPQADLRDWADEFEVLVYLIRRHLPHHDDEKPASLGSLPG